MQHCLDQHTTLDELDKRVDFPVGSMWEYIDDEGKPFADAEGQVISDPGHAVRHPQLFVPECHGASDQVRYCSWNLLVWAAGSCGKPVVCP